MFKDQVYSADGFGSSPETDDNFLSISGRVRKSARGAVAKQARKERRADKKAVRQDGRAAKAENKPGSLRGRLAARKAMKQAAMAPEGEVTDNEEVIVTDESMTNVDVTRPDGSVTDLRNVDGYDNPGDSGDDGIDGFDNAEGEMDYADGYLDGFTDGFDGVDGFDNADGDNEDYIDGYSAGQEDGQLMGATNYMNADGEDLNFFEFIGKKAKARRAARKEKRAVRKTTKKAKKADKHKRKMAKKDAKIAKKQGRAAIRQAKADKKRMEGEAKVAKGDAKLAEAEGAEQGGGMDAGTILDTLKGAAETVGLDKPLGGGADEGGEEESGSGSGAGSGKGKGGDDGGAGAGTDWKKIGLYAGIGVVAVALVFGGIKMMSKKPTGGAAPAGA